MYERCLSQLGLLKYHRLDVLNNRHLFLTVLEAGKFEIRMSADWVPGETSFRLADSHLQTKRKRGLWSLQLFIGVLISHAEKAMAPPPVLLPEKTPWMEEPGSLQSMGSRRVGHD